VKLHELDELIPKNIASPWISTSVCSVYFLIPGDWNPMDEPISNTTFYKVKVFHIFLKLAKKREDYSSIQV